MLNRQRAILALIDEAGGEASHLCVTKWAFLLGRESSSRGGPSFYQFVPYRFGPFSFCLFQEASALARNGYITETGMNWALTRAGRAAARGSDARVRADIGRVVRAHAKRSYDDLIEYVYSRYSWFTVNSQIRKLESRPKVDVAVYTAGYEGILVDGFLNGLMQNGISRVIDVRNNPVSRRYGFHKSTLSRLCGNVGIEYSHFPELGIVSQSRQNLDQPGARKSLFDEYARTTLQQESSAIDAIATLVKASPSVLVCMEACHSECHRSRLAESVARRTRLPIHHLELRP